MKTKKCNVCDKIKSVDDFYKNGIYYKYRCKECEKENNIKYYSNNKEEHNKRCKTWQSLNKQKQKTISKKSYNNLKENKEWKSKKYEYTKKYHKIQYQNNPIFKIKRNLRNRLNDALRNKTKKQMSILKLLSCSIEEFKLYLEKQFLPEMNWENHGVVWEIDHIKPCASFNLIKIEEQKQCFHFSNHQPLFKTTEIAEKFGYKNHIGNRDKSDTV